MGLDVIGFENDKRQLNFVGLVGPHQAIFMMLVNAAAITLCAVIESVMLGAPNLLIISYALWMLYLMNRMMEERGDTLKKSALALTIVVMSVVFFEIYIYAQI